MPGVPCNLMQAAVTRVVAQTYSWKAAPSTRSAAHPQDKIKGTREGRLNRVPARPLPKRAGELIGARGTASERDLNGETRPDTPARAHAVGERGRTAAGLAGPEMATVSAPASPGGPALSTVISRLWRIKR